MIDRKQLFRAVDDNGIHAIALPIAAERLALSAHVRLENLNDWPRALQDLTEVAGKLGIEHVTFQPESAVVVQAVQFRQR